MAIKRTITPSKPKKSDLQFARTSRNLALKGKTNKKLKSNSKARQYQIV